MHETSGLAAFFAHLRSDRRFAAMLGLGFSSGIPFQLIYGTQSAWLMKAGVPIKMVGLLSAMTFAYKLKFVWAPFLDRYDAPVLGRLLGRRRGWIVASQIGIAAALVGVAFGDPRHWLAWTIVFSLALGLAGATQDITIDGWRITATPDKLPQMTSIAEIGWRVGTLASGAGALILSDRIGWRGAYIAMAALMLPGLLSALGAPEPAAERVGEGDRGPLSRASLVQTIVTPIREMVTRLGPMAVPILVLVAGFRMPGYVSSAMAVPLFKSLHYSNTDIATVTKLFGFWVALGGTFLSGWLVPRIGMMASLMAGTVAGSASHLALAWLAAHGDHAGSEFWTFAIAVSIDSFAYAFASVVLITYMSTLTTTAHAASQYALLTSLVALPGFLLAAGSGLVIDYTGFTAFFVGTSLIGVPVALLCLWVWRTHTGMKPAPAADERYASSRRRRTRNLAALEPYLPLHG